MNILKGALCLLIIAILTTGAYRVLNEKWILYRSGEDHDQRGELHQAVQDYARASELGLQRKGLETRLLQCYLDTGDKARAVKLIESMLAADPQNPSLQLKAARIYLFAGRYHEALPFLRKALARNPGNRELRIELARVLVWIGHPEEATELYKQALGESS